MFFKKEKSRKIFLFSLQNKTNFVFYLDWIETRNNYYMDKINILLFIKLPYTFPLEKFSFMEKQSHLNFLCKTASKLKWLHCT